MPVNYERLLRSFAEDSIVAVRQQFRSTGAIASGRSADSLRYDSSPKRLTMFGSDALKYEERPRRPGKVPYNFSEIILRWMQDKGINPRGISEKSAAFLIARSIMRKGASFKERDLFTNVLTEERINDLLKKTSDQARRETLSDIISTFRNQR